MPASNRRRRLLRIAAVALPVVLYLLLAGGSLRRPAPSGDAATVWAAPFPARTVLCVTEVEGSTSLLLAGAVSDGDRAAVDAGLKSRAVEQRLGPLRVLHEDHTYRARIGIAGWSLPWMVNDYTGGFPEWASILATRAFGAREAGTWVHVVLGALVLLGVGLVALRLGGPLAAALAGGALATDLWFHAYKKLLNGTEVWLQLLTLAAAVLVARALARRRSGPAIAASFVVGLGLHVKMSFAGAAFGGAVAALPFLPWDALRSGGGRRRAGRLALLCAFALGLGFGPTWTFWAAGSRVPEVREWAKGQEHAGLRLREAVSRFAPVREGPETADAEPRPGDRAAASPGKGYGLLDAVVRPRGWWRRYLAHRSSEVPSGRPPSAGVAWSIQDRAGAASGGLLGLVGLWGLGAAIRRRLGGNPPVEAGPGSAPRRFAGVHPVGTESVYLGCLALVTPFAVRLMHPDPHHIGMWIPLLALALGLFVADVLGRLGRAPGRVFALGLLASAVLAATGARISDLLAFDEDVVRLAGGVTDARGVGRLAAAVERHGSSAPALLQYQLLSLLEAETDGRVRPFHYSRSMAGGRPGCASRYEPAWASAVLRAHRGELVIEAQGPPDPRIGPLLPARLSEAEWQSAARRAGVRQRVVETLEDSRGRWFATLRRVEEE